MVNVTVGDIAREAGVAPRDVAAAAFQARSEGRLEEFERDVGRFEAVKRAEQKLKSSPSSRRQKELQELKAILARTKPGFREQVKRAAALAKAEEQRARTEPELFRSPTAIITETGQVKQSDPIRATIDKFRRGVAGVAAAGAGFTGSFIEEEIPTTAETKLIREQSTRIALEKAIQREEKALAAGKKVPTPFKSPEMILEGLEPSAGEKILGEVAKGGIGALIWPVTGAELAVSPEAVARTPKKVIQSFKKDPVSTGARLTGAAIAALALGGGSLRKAGVKSKSRQAIATEIEGLQLKPVSNILVKSKDAKGLLIFSTEGVIGATGKTKSGFEVAFVAAERGKGLINQVVRTPKGRFGIGKSKVKIGGQAIIRNPKGKIVDVINYKGKQANQLRVPLEKGFTESRIVSTSEIETALTGKRPTISREVALGEVRPITEETAFGRFRVFGEEPTVLPSRSAKDFLFKPESVEFVERAPVGAIIERSPPLFEVQLPTARTAITPFRTVTARGKAPRNPFKFTPKSLEAGASAVIREGFPIEGFRPPRARPTARPGKPQTITDPFTGQKVKTKQVEAAPRDIQAFAAGSADASIAQLRTAATKALRADVGVEIVPAAPITRLPSAPLSLVPKPIEGLGTATFLSKKSIPIIQQADKIGEATRTLPAVAPVTRFVEATRVKVADVTLPKLSQKTIQTPKAIANFLAPTPSTGPATPFTGAARPFGFFVPPFLPRARLPKGRRRVLRPARTRTAFLPSLKAIVKNIRTTEAPKGPFTGLEVRPIIGTNGKDPFTNKPLKKKRKK